MSEFQDDKAILEKKDNRLTNVDAPLRDQIPAKLMKRLEDMNVGHKVDQLWRLGDGDRSNWLQRQQKFFKDWDNFIDVTVAGPFEQSSNLHLPLSFIVAKTYHARMLQAVLSNPPSARARRADSVERAATVSALINYTIHEWANEYKGIQETIDIWLWDWITTGVGIKKWRWDVQYTRFMDVQEVEEPGAPEFFTNEEGEELSVQRTKVVEREGMRTIKKFEGPCLDRVPPEDVIIIGGGGDPDRAEAVMQQIWMTKHDLYMHAYRKVFEESKVDEIIRRGRDEEVTDESTNIKQDREDRAGVQSKNVEVDQDKYRIIEAYLRLDVDNSGIDSDVVVWVHPETRQILRATYLHRINKGGKRPFVKVDFHKRTDQVYGMGLVEVLHPITREMDLMHNLRIDFGMISTMPFGFYRASSSIEPENIRYEPGMLIPVDDPQRDVFFPNLGNRTSFGLQEEQQLNLIVERLTGISDLNLGVLSGQQGATRTATGTRALVGEANANLDVHLRRLGLARKKSKEYLLHMIQQRIPEGMGFKITGDEGNDYWSYIRNRQDIAGDFDFEIDPASANSNPQVTRERAIQILNTTLNPLLIQTGVVSVANIYESVKNFLKANDVKAFSRYITKPRGAEIQLTPEETANRVLRGMSVNISPNDDHEGFLNFFNLIMKEDELLGQFTEQEIATLASHARERTAMQQALRQQAAQAANIRQQQANAANSQDQAPQALNPVQTQQPGG